MTSQQELLSLLEQFKDEVDKLDDDIRDRMFKDVETTIRMAFLDQLARDSQAMGDYG